MNSSELDLLANDTSVMGAGLKHNLSDKEIVKNLWGTSGSQRYDLQNYRVLVKWDYSGYRRWLRNHGQPFVIVDTEEHAKESPL